MVHNNGVVYKLYIHNPIIIIYNNGTTPLDMSHLPGLKSCAWLFFRLHSWSHKNLVYILQCLKKSMLKLGSSFVCDKVKIICDYKVMWNAASRYV